MFARRPDAKSSARHVVVTVVLFAFCPQAYGYKPQVYVGAPLFYNGAPCPRNGIQLGMNEVLPLLKAHFLWLETGGAKGKYVNFCGVDLGGVRLQTVRLGRADLRMVNLNGADLSEADLEKANLDRADLSGTNLAGANLNGAILSRANLAGANLNGAILSGVDLTGANLSFATLIDTQLKDAFLYNTDFRGARIIRTVFQGAKLNGAQISGSIFEPAIVPSQSYVTEIKGTRSVMFHKDRDSGLVQLRTAFRNAGLRRQEREATFALERMRTNFLLGARLNKRGEVVWETLLIHIFDRPDDVIEGIFRRVVFEWTTDYGLSYGRALWWFVLGILIGAIVYMIPLSFRPHHPRAGGGIYRIWPKERIVVMANVPKIREDIRVERLCPRGFGILGYAFYFSLLSAFHIGWRDLNVGSWISRVQPSEFVLRARGWVRVVSGLHSLLSVSLIALFLLTYFGRLFD